MDKKSITGYYNPNNGLKITYGCPRGHWHPKQKYISDVTGRAGKRPGRCDVAMQTVSVEAQRGKHRCCKGKSRGKKHGKKHKGKKRKR